MSDSARYYRDDKNMLLLQSLRQTLLIWEYLQLLRTFHTNTQYLCSSLYMHMCMWAEEQASLPRVRLKA